MTQLAPSTLLYDQALVLIQDLINNLRNGSIQSVDDLTVGLQDILNRYDLVQGGPLTQFDPFVQGEPPLSEKINRLWTDVESDTTILQRQFDVARAAAIYTHNLLVTELNRSKLLNNVLHNKVSNLALFSSSVDQSIVAFKESFGTDDNIDMKFMSAGEVPSILSDAYLALGRQTQSVELAPDAGISVIQESSNGIIGNNQEIKDPASAVVPAAGDSPYYEFVGETKPSNNLVSIKDGSPTTWFEYESCWVSESDRLSANNYNFEYVRKLGGFAEKVDWAKGPSDDVLKLGLEFDLGDVRSVNYLSFTPYGLENNENYPILVTKISTSETGSTWLDASPSNVWLGSAVNLQTARSADNVTIGTGVWSFFQRNVRYVRVFMEQPRYMSKPIGHLYYYDEEAKKRIEGPLPEETDIPASYDPSTLHLDKDVVQKREWFNGRRWAIGIRDVDISQIAYQLSSTLVSTPIRAGGVVERVVLDAETYIPAEFDQEASWVRFFISGDNGSTWTEISRIEDNYLGLPEIIAFNDPTPSQFQESGVAYVSTANPVTEIRVKVELSRPEEITYASPLLRSYTVRMKKR